MPAVAIVDRFLGRPAARCRKCKSTVHIVNQFGGIECSSCTKEQGEFPRLYVVDGKWSDEPDEWEPVAKAESRGSAEPESLNWIDELDARLNRSANRGKVRREIAWESVDMELAELVQWFLSCPEMLMPVGQFELHRPGRTARNLQDMNYQLTRQVVDSEKFYSSLKCEICVQGPRGPRVRTGTLKEDLKRLRAICEV